MSPDRRQRRFRRGATALALAAAALLAAAPFAAAWADPPPWAPAHGWRAKQHHHYGDHYPGYVYARPDHRYAYPEHGYGYPDDYYDPYGGYYDPYGTAAGGVPFGIDRGHCDRELVGGLLGGLAGGVAGAEIAGRDDRVAGIVGGTIVGMVLGGAIGRSMDRTDYGCFGQTLEHGGYGQPVEWQNPNGYRYEVLPQQPYEHDGRRCRDYVTTGVIDGRMEELYGTACRRPDGSWELVG